MGGLFTFAAAHPEARPAVATATLIEEAGIAVAFALVRRRPFARRLHMVAAFDTACVMLSAAWLVAS